MIITIVGPTGVGKTKLSVQLAKKYNAEIINGDSMQVYKKLDIGTAKPTKSEQENVKHHLFDFVDIDTNYTVYDYQKDSRQKITEILSKNKNVVIVGGTGLYIKACLYNYQFTEGTTNKSYADFSNIEIVNKIKEYDVEEIPHINNRKRLVRLLNKLENGEAITNNKNELLYPNTIFVGLTLEREKLYKRINMRVDKMFEEGLEKEVEEVKEYFKTSKALQTGIGYKEFKEYLCHNKTLEEVKEEIKKNSRHYAKRQYTFFNNQMDVKWFNVDLVNFTKTIDEVSNYIEENKND